MHGRHLKKRGRWWHYYRNRPVRYKDIEPRATITFALKTTCISKAKLQAAKISADLEQQWDGALKRSSSLQNQSSKLKYKASIETNNHHGFHPISVNAMLDAQLIDRLAYLLNHQVPNSEQKALLGLAEKPPMTLIDAFDRFWDHIEDEWIRHSHDQKRAKRNIYLKSIRNFEVAIGKYDLYDITRTHAVEFRSWWMKRKKENNLKSYTGNREISSLRRLITVNFEIDAHEGPNPFTNLRLKKDKEVRRAPLTNTLIQNKLLAAGKLDGLQPNFQLLVKILINTGMRPVEAIGMEVDDIYLDHNIPHVYIRENSVRILKTRKLLGVLLPMVMDARRRELRPNSFGVARL